MRAMRDTLTRITAWIPRRLYHSIRWFLIMAFYVTGGTLIGASIPLALMFSAAYFGATWPGAVAMLLVLAVVGGCYMGKLDWEQEKRQESRVPESLKKD
jgi:uncharacterized membrane protein